VMGLLAYAGGVEDGQRAIAPFRALATPIADMVRPMSYPELFPPGEEGFHPVTAAHTMFVDSVDRRDAETILDRIEASTATMAATQIRVLGGAMARVHPRATAFAHRHSRILVNVAAMFERQEERAVHEAWVDGLSTALLQRDTGAYAGFLGDEGEERVRAAYPGSTWDRLVAIKGRYDPGNLFRLNQNIPPA
jgi:FAD/FMN-containing dehydrogenase